jgi:hypothetical protein
VQTRSEHLEWCKQRARKYLDANNPEEAIASMLSDMNKHPETRKAIEGPLGMIGLMSTRTVEEARRYIEGFN